MNTAGNCQSRGRRRRNGIVYGGSQGKYLVCATGCETCVALVSGGTACTAANDGYSIVGSSLIKCNVLCKTCSGTTATDCLSCYPGTSVYAGTCTSCTDPNALSCLSTNAAYAVICKKGYTSAFYTSNSATQEGGTCQACALHCNKCDQNGPGNCDEHDCVTGFVQLTGTTNCSQCFGGCPKCSPDDFNTCL